MPVDSRYDLKSSTVHETWAGPDRLSLKGTLRVNHRAHFSLVGLMGFATRGDRVFALGRAAGVAGE
jgi:hypothetical protein